MKKYIEKTIKYYDENCKAYSEEWSNNFTDNFNFEIPNIFTSYLRDGAYILDLGCGHGRDTAYFIEKGYKVKAIDGSLEMCKLASKLAGINVEQINFLDMNYDNEFDGIFACASLLHLNNKDLIVVLNKISKALKKDGILMVSFKYGVGERIKGERFFNDMTEDKFRKLCEEISGLEIESFFENDGFQKHGSFINFVLKKVR